MAGEVVFGSSLKSATKCVESPGPVHCEHDAEQKGRTGESQLHGFMLIFIFVFIFVFALILVVVFIITFVFVSAFTFVFDLYSYSYLHLYSYLSYMSESELQSKLWVVGPYLGRTWGSIQGF